MNQRSEEEKVSQVPVKVILGGKEYGIKPLVIKDSREWRKKVVAALSELPKYAEATTAKPEEFKAALNNMLVAMPDKVFDLFLDYARDLNREEIESTATDYEVARAFEEVAALAFPLATSLVNAMAKQSQ